MSHLEIIWNYGEMAKQKTVSQKNAGDFLIKRNPFPDFFFFGGDAFAPTKPTKHQPSSQQDDHCADARHLLSSALWRKTMVQWPSWRNQKYTQKEQGSLHMYVYIYICMNVSKSCIYMNWRQYVSVKLKYIISRIQTGHIYHKHNLRIYSTFFANSFCLFMQVI